jgi:predicted N-acyltransferase
MGKNAGAQLQVRWVNAISQVPKDMWNALALPLNTPFLEWEWLYLLEDSGSICPETGWDPRHLTLWKDDTLVAAAPLYIKTHSEGEFVFDYIWARVAAQLSIPYYPKLVGMSPVTPVPGYRFLLAADQDEARLTEFMLREIDGFCAGQGLSGVHFLYTDPQWRERIIRYGYIAWMHQVFEWPNPGYANFDDYLGSFKKSQRRNIRRERKKLIDQGITIRGLAGREIEPRLFGKMYDFYMATNYKFGPWACNYLTGDFFTRLPDGFGRRVVLMAAYATENSREPLGLALFFRKNDSLFGRYWGSAAVIDSLHFNTCYYAPIEWAINNGIRRFDPGIGSEHKVRRGFRALGNYSLHRFYSKTLALVMRSNIGRFNLLEQQNIDELNSLLPVNSPAIL